MRKLTLAASVVTLIAAASTYTYVASAQDDASQDDASQIDAAQEPSMDEMMAAWMRAGTPGEEHRALDAFIGTWDATVKMWMDPTAEPEVSKGVMVNSWILDGRHMKEEFKGEAGGMPFTGLGLWGFDVAAGRYYGTWSDSMSTALMVSYGPRSKDGVVFEMSGENTNPMTGKRDRADQVITIDGPDKHTMEMYEYRGGQRVKTMEIVYERAKK